MKRKITLYIGARGDVVVDVPPNMDLAQAVSYFGEATRILYNVIIEEEARKRAMEKSEMDELVRLLLKQKNPKMN